MNGHEWKSGETRWKLEGGQLLQYFADDGWTKVAPNGLVTAREILRLAEENAALRTEVERWKVAVDGMFNIASKEGER